MKSYLLAGCAAAALAFGAGTAGAQTATGPGPGKFQVTIGGDAYFDAGFVSEGADSNANNGLRTVEFANRFRLVVTPKATADNGISYGGRIRLRASGLGGDQRAVDTDQAYIFVSGTFGELRGGEVEGPSHGINAYINRPIDWQLQAQHDRYRDFLTAQNASAAPGIDNAGNVYGASLVGNTTLSPVGAANLAGTSPGSAQYTRASGSHFFQTELSADPGTKVVYITPRFSGVQGAVSYMPRSIDYNANATRTTRAGVGTAAGYGAPYNVANNGLASQGFQDVFEVTANYTGEFSGVMIKAMAGYQGGYATKDNVQANITSVTDRYEDLSSWQVGAQLGYAGVVIGGGYVNSGTSGYTKAPWIGAANKGTQQVAGTTPYKVMLDDQWSWNAGIQYTVGPVVVGFGYTYAEDAGNLIVAGARKLSQYSVGGKYTVAPGFTVGLEYTYFDANDDRPNGNSTFTNAGNTYNSNAVLGGNANTNYDDSGSVVLLRTGLAF